MAYTERINPDNSNEKSILERTFEDVRSTAQDVGCSTFHVRNHHTNPEEETDLIDSLYTLNANKNKRMSEIEINDTFRGFSNLTDIIEHCLLFK